MMTQFTNASLGLIELTHWGREKMAANFPDNIFKCIFTQMKNIQIFINISLNFVP